MNLGGIIIGIAVFVIIGVFHPIVIKAEYYFGRKVWPVFLICGILFTALSLFFKNTVVSAILSSTGFTCLWTIKEVFEQEARVKKGWFPKNPNRKG